MVLTSPLTRTMEGRGALPPLKEGAAEEAEEEEEDVAQEGLRQPNNHPTSLSRKNGSRNFSITRKKEHSLEKVRKI